MGLHDLPTGRAGLVFSCLKNDGLKQKKYFLFTRKARSARP
jgi:hypothetical protein